jgi:hypothetical protein
LQCGKADVVNELPVGDRPGHTFWIAKGKCIWTKPIEIAGAVTKEEYTESGESIGNRDRSRGVAVFIMDNGNKCYFAYSSSTTAKEGILQSGEETWSFAGGTGRLKGITGKGTVKGKPAGEGKSIWEIDGEYQLPK